MAMGYLPFGIVPFAAVKFLGYSAAGLLIQHAHRPASELAESSPPHSAPRSPWLFGAVRTLIGIAAGLAYASAWEAVGANPGLPLWWLFLLPVRLIEWAVVIWWFFGRHPMKRFVLCVLAGALWSYILDLPALAAVWVTPGAAWVC